MYEDCKMFKLYNINTKQILYIGSTKVRLCNKLAEMKYVYIINKSCSK